VGWQVYGLRHQAFDLALVGLVLFVPQLLLAIPAGIIADRFDRRLVCVLATCGDATAVLAFVALILSGTHSLVLSLCVVLLIGIAHAIGDPAERSLLSGIVKAHHYIRAQAMTTTISQIITIAGPAVGGVLIAIGTPVAFAVSAGAYVLAAFAYSFLTPRPTDDTPVELGSAIGGVRFIFSHPVILGAITLDLFAVLFGGATALLPIYATQILHVGPIGYGALTSAPAVGAMFVGGYLARRPLDRNAGMTLIWVVAGFGVATIVFGLSHNLILSLVALAATGGFDIVSVVIRSALVQLDTPNEMRGRVSAVENIFIGASNQLGSFESGTAAALLGPVAAVVLGGIATLVVIVIAARVFPALRRYDRLGTATT
jgi:MFS family permease